MKRLILILFGISAIVVAHQAHALIVLSTAHLTIAENTTGSDATFHVSLKEYSNSLYVGTTSFDIQTAGGLGSADTYIDTFSGSSFVLSETVPDGLALSDIQCSSDAAGVIFQKTNESMNITPVANANITCTFSNSKSILKMPVLIVPGLLGTEMEDNRELLWEDSLRMSYTVGDAFMDPLAFNPNLQPTNPSVAISDVIGKKTFAGFTFDYTTGLVQEFENQGYAEGDSATSTLFMFPYDWRYGVSGVMSNGSTVADELAQKISEIRALTGSDKVDVVAHSTGGLVVKQYLMDHPTDNHIGKLVFVGVPNLGAPEAAKALLQGDNFGIPFLSDAEMKKLAANFPVTYDLAPSEQYVAENGSYLGTYTNENGPGTTLAQDLDYSGTENFLINDRGFNGTALAGADATHAQLDSLDPRADGVDMYSIVGCKSGTLGFLTEDRTKLTDGSVTVTGYSASDITGDGTVPMTSASAVPEDSNHVFYALAPNHGKMLSADGTRQEIVNLISGSDLGTSGKILTQAEVTSDPSQCALSGHWLGIFSPVSIEVTDQNGNRAGLADDGSVQNDIPGADYEVLGEHKFVFLPTDGGQQYSINLAGTGDGTFTIKDQVITDGVPAETAVWGGVPVSTGAAGSVSLGTATAGTSALSFDENGDGQEEPVAPSLVASGDVPDDFTPPTITIASPESGDYLHSDSLTIDAASTDNGTGVKTLKLSLDGAPVEDGGTVDLFYQTLGDHTLSATSTDLVGNVATSSVSFQIIATPESTVSDIKRAYSLQWLTSKAAEKFLIAKIQAGVRLDGKLETIEKKLKGKTAAQKVSVVQEKLDTLIGNAVLRQLARDQKLGVLNDEGYATLSADVKWLMNPPEEKEEPADNEAAGKAAGLKRASGKDGTDSDMPGKSPKEEPSAQPRGQTK